MSPRTPDTVKPRLFFNSIDQGFSHAINHLQPDGNVYLVGKLGDTLPTIPMPGRSTTSRSKPRLSRPTSAPLYPPVHHLAPIVLRLELPFYHKEETWLNAVTV